MAHTVIGIFDNTSTAQSAIERLTATGISRDNIDVNYQTQETGGPTDDRRTNNDDDSFGDRISDFFKNLFDDDDEQTYKRYDAVSRTGTVLTVHAQSMDEAERAAEIMDEHGAIDVNERAQQHGITDAYGTDRNIENDDIRSDVNRDDNQSIPVIEEDMQVGKREVETGGVRIRSRIIERPVEEHLRLREEHVRFERRPVNRPATAADLDSFREGEVEIREHSEVPVVNKEARVVEEINVRKEVTNRDETVRDTVRKTDVDVDQVEGDKEAYSSRKDNL